MGGGSGRGAGETAVAAVAAPPVLRWTEAQLAGAVAGVAASEAAPPSWDQLSEPQRRLYAVRVSQEPALTLGEAARALGITRGAADERWMQVRMLTGCPSLEPTRQLQLGADLEDGAGGALTPVPNPEHVTDTDLVLLTRRRALEGVLACQPTGNAREFKDLTVAVGNLMKISHEIAAQPVELERERRREADREAVRGLAQGILAQLAKRGLSVRIDSAPVVEAQYTEARSESSSPGQGESSSAPAPADALENV